MNREQLKYIFETGIFCVLVNNRNCYAFLPRLVLFATETKTPGDENQRDYCPNPPLNQPLFEASLLSEIRHWRLLLLMPDGVLVLYKQVIVTVSNINITLFTGPLFLHQRLLWVGTRTTPYCSTVWDIFIGPTWIMTDTDSNALPPSLLNTLALPLLDARCCYVSGRHGSPGYILQLTMFF
jgi:hypothetical protein